MAAQAEAKESTSAGVSGDCGGDVDYRCVTLSDGRKLAFTEYGDLDNGYPVIFMHGNLNSRLFRPVWGDTDDVTKKCGARVIAVDRPGYGRSDYLSHRTYMSCADDVRQLSANLSLTHYAVIGFSSGGPNALVCAHTLPAVTAVALVSSDAPYHSMGADALQRMFGATPLTQALATEHSLASAETLRESYTTMKQKERGAMALGDLQEAMRQGVECGPSQDAMLESRDWGFPLSLDPLDPLDPVDPLTLELAAQAGLPPCMLWHGEKDSDVPVEMGLYLASALNGPGDDEKKTLNRKIETHFIPGESHSLIRRHWGTILTDLVAAAKAHVSNSGARL